MNRGLRDAGIGSVVVVGAVNVDFVVDVDRLPGPGETVVGLGVRQHGGGKGANAAVAASRAGAEVCLIGAVGADTLGTTALAQLRGQGVDVTEVVTVADRPTGMALIVVAADGENQIAVGAGANAAVSPEQVEAALRRRLGTAGCVLVSTEIPGASAALAVRLARAAGVRCVLNPAPVVPEILDVLETGPVLTPNSAESGQLAGLLASRVGGQPPGGGPGASPSEAGAPGGDPALLGDAPAAAAWLAAITRSPVAVTLGAGGALLAGPDAEVRQLPARPALVRDTTGAGDTFNGVLAARLAAGDDMVAALDLAMVAAALSVGQAGARTGMPTAAAIAAAAARAG